VSQQTVLGTEAEAVRRAGSSDGSREQGCLFPLSFPPSSVVCVRHSLLCSPLLSSPLLGCPGLLPSASHRGRRTHTAPTHAHHTGTEHMIARTCTLAPSAILSVLSGFGVPPSSVCAAAAGSSDREGERGNRAGGNDRRQGEEEDRVAESSPAACSPCVRLQAKREPKFKPGKKTVGVPRRRLPCPLLQSTVTSGTIQQASKL
jgi:hypothetical protein